MKHVLILFIAVTAAAAAPPTARQVVERIQKQAGIPWRAETIDTFKTGNPDTAVTGIATTFIATMDVLRRAAASGKNLIITHEPTFYNHHEKTEDIKGNAVLAAKQAFIAKHGLIVWRFHDHWHMRRPDGIMAGMTAALGWERFRDPAREGLFTVPEMTVGGLAAGIRDRLKLRTIRVVGDPALKVTRVGFSPGSAGAVSHIKALGDNRVEVLLVGETTEWQAVEYARDASASGKPKAMILLGHVVSEEAGMLECARWLKTFIREVPVEFIPAGEPFWEPRP